MRFKLAGFPMSTPGSRRCGEDRSRELPRDRVHHWALIGLVDSNIMRSPISLTSLSHGHSGPLALHNLALRIMGERQKYIEGQSPISAKEKTCIRRKQFNSLSLF